MTPSATASLTGVLQISITVKEIDRATAFYRDVLALPLLMTAPNMAFFNCGGVRLYLDGAQGSEHTGSGSGSLIYFRTPDIDAFHADAKTKKILIHQEPQIIARMPDHDLWMTFFHDTEENLLALMSEVKR